MKTIITHISAGLLILSIAFIPCISNAQFFEKEKDVQPENLIIKALSLQLKLTPDQIKKTNEIYKQSIDTSLDHSVDFEGQLRKILDEEQKIKLEQFLNLGSARQSMKYSIKK
jgi:hypothetical protein